jgi:hypothetical protein
MNKNKELLIGVKTLMSLIKKEDLDGSGHWWVNGIVEEPRGEDQFEDSEFYLNRWVDQKHNSLLDSFWGEVYYELDKNKWLCIGFSD